MYRRNNTHEHLLCRSTASEENARSCVGVCVDAFEVCEVNTRILQRALKLTGSDFEDNVQIACAEARALDGILTRDKTGFADSNVRVFTAAELLALI